MADALCLVDGCSRKGVPKKGGLCHGHHKRKERGMAVEAELRPWGEPAVTLRRAALAYNEAESDQDFRRAEQRLIMAGRRMGRRLTK